MKFRKTQRHKRKRSSRHCRIRSTRRNCKQQYRKHSKSKKKRYRKMNRKTRGGAACALACKARKHAHLITRTRGGSVGLGRAPRAMKAWFVKNETGEGDEGDEEKVKRKDEPPPPPPPTPPPPGSEPPPQDSDDEDENLVWREARAIARYAEGKRNVADSVAAAREAADED